MPRIAAIETAVPALTVNQEEARRLAGETFAGALDGLDRRLQVFERSGIKQRHLCVSPDWLSRPRSFAERNRVYTEQALSLGERAARGALSRAGIAAAAIDAFFFVSSTGVATPSLDAHLIPRLGMSAHVHRTPIWGLGCAGGAVGLTRAFQYTRAYPRARVLLLAVELCSITFQSDDRSLQNLVAAALFADGAAAALIVGDEAPGRMASVQPAAGEEHPGMTAAGPAGRDAAAPANRAGPAIVDAESTLWPNTLDLMGWEVSAQGLGVIFSRDIPRVVQQEARQAMTGFLGRNGLDLASIEHFILHPGGAKILAAYGAIPGINLDADHPSFQILRNYGNMSSPTVLFVLKETMARRPRTGGWGLLAALGPGLSSEQLLVRW